MELFTIRQYDQVSIDDIARHAGVAHGLISYHFEGKHGVYSAAVTQISNEFLDFQCPRPEETTVSQRIRGFLHRHFEYVRVNPARYRLLIPSAHPDTALQSALAAARSAALAESLRCPTNQPGLVGASLQGWSGFVESVTGCWMTDPGLQIDDVVELCVHSLVGSVNVASGFRHGCETVLSVLAQTAEVDTASE